MKIQIVSSRKLFSSKNHIFVDGNELYFTSSDSIGNNQYKLHEIGTEITKSILTLETSILTDNFKIRLFNPDNILLTFKRIKWYKHNYFCDYNSDRYEIFYINNYYSLVYKNGKEIMNYHRKRKSTVFFTPEYIFNFSEIENTQLELLITICLFIYSKDLNSDD